MLRTGLVHAGFAALALLSIACGSSTETGGGNNSGGGNSGGGGPGSGGGGGGDTGTHAGPPDPGPKNPGDGKGTTFAISKLYLGEGAGEWEELGVDIDNKITSCTTAAECNMVSGLCKPQPSGSPSSIYPDGKDGIDNSFGRNIIPLLAGFVPDISAKANDAIAAGSFTIMLNVQKLGDQDNYNPLVTKLYGGANLGASPKFDGTDQWPVIPELLNNAKDIESAKVQFPNSYVVGNTWVSGSKGDLDLSLSISGVDLKLSIGSAVIYFKMDAAHKHVTGGVIGGVLDTEQLKSELKALAGRFDQSFCTGGTIDGILANIAAQSDIMSDGSQDPNKTCNGISIGLGFDAEVVQLGEIAEPATPSPDPCDKK